MTETDLIILNFEEIRRRSIIVWKSIPEEKLNWRPDHEALSCAEMIRHVAEAELLYHQILVNRGSLTSAPETNPFDEKEFTTVENELKFIQPFRDHFLSYVGAFNKDDLENINIDRSDVGYIRTLGDMLLRIAYHESVHTGQLLGYMRTMGIARPKVWD
ncbi:DinB family protein [Cohnella luojiensis]|uniref:DinB family protein n=1 Tax=Cohnella luojiensis TaxID=652876 RepID=A0A4Y8LXY6_9BACL|nr:DinB family protein [Cohnella luojiensis]TFE25986.1 DinB family protein [Cohnella luojiensis]